jgi:succinoglycan biosynthesis protein ExoA
MRRVLVHAHSTWSHDGEIPLTAYPLIAERLGCSAVLLTEHEESGWDEERYDAYVRACDAASTRRVQLLAGLEFLQSGVHVLCYGLRRLPERPGTAGVLAAAARRAGCVLALAHPGKYRWTVPDEVLQSVDAVEVWNSKWIYDGPAGPHRASIAMLGDRQLIVGQDVHKPKHLSPLQLVTEGTDVIADLAAGRYTIAWKTRSWSPQQLRELSPRWRPSLHRAWTAAVLKTYGALHPDGRSRTASGRPLRRLRPLRPEPTVSVILPVRNEGPFMERALAAIADQDYPAALVECLVVDGASDDDTLEAVRRVAPRFGDRLQVLENPGRIVPTGLNIGLRAARGEVIVRVDGHCEVAPDFLRAAVNHLVRDSVAMVGGVLDTVGDTRTARAIAAAMRTPFGVGGSPFRAGVALPALSDTVAFPGFVREAIERAGPFDEELVRNQDDEYSYRVRHLGGRILLATDIRARYFSRGTLTALWKQYYQYGYWKVRVLQRHPRQMRARQFAPALLVAGLAASALTAVAGWPLLGAALPSVYIAVAAAAAGQAAFRNGWRLFPGLSLAFAAMHLAYGAGFFEGLAAFRGRWRTRVDAPSPAATHQ